MDSQLLLRTLEQEGIPCADIIHADGNIHRYKTKGDHNPDCWYVIHDHGDFAAGAFGYWKRDFKQKWWSRQKLSPEQWEIAKKSIKASLEQEDIDRKEKQAKAREFCQTLFKTAPPIPADYPYLVTKTVPILGNLRSCTMPSYAGWLAIPLQDINGTIHSAQYVADNGAKRFHFGGMVKGCFFPIGSLDNHDPLVIAEGYATAASVHIATGYPTIAAMNAGNLESVAKAFRAKYPDRLMVIAADDDQFKDKNTGLNSAKKAIQSKELNGVCLAIPTFSDSDMGGKPTDFNDLHRLSGLKTVRKQIINSFPVHATELGDFHVDVKNDPAELIRDRYICQTTILLICGPTGIGKSSFSMQKAIHFANGLPFFGLPPVRPMRILGVQAENNDGDIVEMRDGIMSNLNLTAEQQARALQNIYLRRCVGVVGESFRRKILEPLLILHKPDLILIDPGDSYIEGSSSDAADVNNFLCQQIEPVLEKHNCAAIIVGHTAKPSKERANWRNSHRAYIKSGSVLWSTTPRAILDLEPLNENHLYRLNASKRADRLMWADASGNPTSERLIAWSQMRRIIFWREANQEEINSLKEKQSASSNGESSLGRPPKCTPEKLVALLEPSPLSASQWRNIAIEQFAISRETFYRLLREIENNGLAEKFPITGTWSKINPQSQSNLI